MYSDRHSRRRFLKGAGVTAAAISIGPAVLPVAKLLEEAGAQTAPPSPAELAAFAETVELAAVAFYGEVRSHVSTPAVVSAMNAYAKHHQDHANAIGPLGADKRTQKPNTGLLQTLEDRLSRAKNENDAVEIAYDLEGGLASTYLFIVATTDDASVVQACANALPVESQHAVVLGTAAGKSDKDVTAPDAAQTGYETEDKHFDPATFPTAETTTTSTVAGKK